MLERGVAPWQKPWDDSFGLPHNPVTASRNGTNGRYQGGNFVYLQAVQLMRGYSDPRWVTFHQTSRMRRDTMTPLSDADFERNRCLRFDDPDRVPTWHVRKGEHGTLIEKWGVYEKKSDAGDEPEKSRRQLYFKPYYVFNLCQIEGAPLYERAVQTWTVDESFAIADRIIADMGVPVETGAAACYWPSRDLIHMPPRAAFASAMDWYATLLHETAHATGAAHRLNRPTLTGGHPFGSDGYAKEELRAEIGSMLLANETGIPNDPSRHVAYVGSWIKALKSDANEIFRAAKDAAAIVDFMFGLEHRLETGEIQPSVADDAMALEVV